MTSSRKTQSHQTIRFGSRLPSNGACMRRPVLSVHVRFPTPSAWVTCDGRLKKNLRRFRKHMLNRILRRSDTLQSDNIGHFTSNSMAILRLLVSRLDGFCECCRLHIKNASCQPQPPLLPLKHLKPRRLWKRKMQILNAISSTSLSWGRHLVMRLARLGLSRVRLRHHIWSLGWKSPQSFVKPKRTLPFSAHILADPGSDVHGFQHFLLGSIRITY